MAVVAKTLDSPLPPKDQWYRWFHPFEAYLKTRGARPHWAKDHTLDHDYLHNQANPLAFSEFKEQCQTFDPQGLLGTHIEV